MTTFDTKYLEKILQALSKLPNIKEVTALRKRLKDEIRKITTTPTIKPKPSREEKRLSANRKRSGKMLRYHNYVRQIRNNYPDLSYSEIRKQFSSRKRGDDISIPDAIWQNPSP